MPRETQLSTAVKDYLELLKNAGTIIWHDRLQSGLLFAKMGPRSYPVHLCKKGTPDRYAILKDGRMLWIEIKTPTERLRDEQLDFKRMIDKMPKEKHVHVTIRYIDELRRLFE